MTRKDFTHTIRRRKDYYGKSLGLLAKETGISKGNLSKIFSGHGDPQLSTMNKLSKALYFEIQHNGGGL